MLGCEQRTWHVMISGCAESRFPESFGLLVRERDGGVAGAAAGEAGDGDGAAGAADGTPLADTLPAPPPWPCPRRPPVAPTAGARGGGRQRGLRPRRGRQPWPRELRPKRWWEGGSGGDGVGGGGCLVTDVCVLVSGDGGGSSTGVIGSSRVWLECGGLEVAGGGRRCRGGRGYGGAVAVASWW